MLLISDLDPELSCRVVFGDATLFSGKKRFIGTEFAMTEETKFKGMSAEVAKRFLQTVVVVDDEAAFTSEENVSRKDVEPPSRPVPVDKDAADEEEEAQEEVPTWDDEAHRLDAKQVIDAFAKQGLVCAILRPESQEEVRYDEGEDSLLDRVVRVADRSDLVVLDWDIGKDGGEKTRQIIEKLSEEDIGGRPQYLRLIVVYTGEGALDKIADSIAEVLEPENRQDDGLVLRRGPIRVAVYAKADARNIGPHAGRMVSFSELPERLIADFAEITKGIVSNVAVESLSVLRENTYSLLTRLHSGLDAPYLTHRLLLEFAQRRRYKWIADLKYEQAQRDISRFAEYISRIGFDEFEWLRRSAK